MGQAMSDAPLTVRGYQGTEVANPAHPYLYIVTRSDAAWMTSEPPCDFAFRVLIPLVESRDTPLRDFTDREKGRWYGHGGNHREENGRPRRDVGAIGVWAVLVPNIRAFLEKEGRCVLDLMDGYQTIEIYDDYRE